jgi:RimJ/RimL family protein N-acetyltransferase
MPSCLETERLALRQFTEGYVDTLFELDSDPEVMRFINGGVPTPRDAIEARILPWLMSFDQKYEDLGFWAAHEETNSDFIGWFGLRPEEGRDPDDLALGYRLRRKFWRKGYGTEGSRALIEKAFYRLGARRVFATTYSENFASRRVMEKCGMRLVRTYRMSADDAPMTYVATDPIFPADDVEYALDRVDWERTSAISSRSR